jgi:hypothetical protein
VAKDKTDEAIILIKLNNKGESDQNGIKKYAENLAEKSDINAEIHFTKE